MIELGILLSFIIVILLCIVIPLMCDEYKRNSPKSKNIYPGNRGMGPWD